ncbi:MAG: hypothetical protein RMX96_33300 [Nostoc sp. ChiSLP02]|nr:hypothetical protein [Nostoc sp. DedSLP05]MDZ8102471.1 hypothetical protein [Nostoc sp. DedSLP01]MDZ8189701.1 hypothetical protein [Nostoc sp. ChiSLP02]
MTSIREHYDIIMIGTGAGLGTLARYLAFTGKKILLERGDFLPREKANALRVADCIAQRIK